MWPATYAFSEFNDVAFTREERIIFDKEFLKNAGFFFQNVWHYEAVFPPDDVKPGFISLLGLWKIVILPHLIRRKFHLVCSLWCLLMACGNFISWFRRLPALVNVGNVAPGNLRGHTAYERPIISVVHFGAPVTFCTPFVFSTSVLNFEL